MSAIVDHKLKIFPSTHKITGITNFWAIGEARKTFRVQAIDGMLWKGAHGKCSLWPGEHSPYKDHGKSKTAIEIIFFRNIDWALTYLYIRTIGPTLKERKVHFEHQIIHNVNLKTRIFMHKAKCNRLKRPCFRQRSNVTTRFICEDQIIVLYLQII